MNGIYEKMIKRTWEEAPRLRQEHLPLRRPQVRHHRPAAAELPSSSFSGTS
jgi:hypothetical protein